MILNYLSVTENPFTELKHEMFSSASITYIESDDYRVCCIKPNNSECSEPKPWYLNCSDLLPQLSMRVCLGLVCLFISFLNILSTVLYLSNRKHQEGPFLLNLIFGNVCDLFCFLYLFIIFFADVLFNRKFVVRQIAWQNSVPCKIVFGLSLYFSLLSPVLTAFMALSRLMVVLKPLDSKFKDISFVKKTPNTLHTGCFQCCSCFVCD